jgi:hypothetical protein
MASFQTTPDIGMQDDMVTRVGIAAGKVARIQQDYALQAEHGMPGEAREALASKARASAEQVLADQGVSVDEYNAVLVAAENDQDLERRLLNAAREVL